MDFKKIKELSLDPIKKESFAPWALFMLISILPFLSMIAYLSTDVIAEKQEHNIDNRFMENMKITIQNKAVLIDTWLENKASLAQRITRSRTIQMFVMDVNNSGMNIGFEGALKERKLYIEEVLSTFVSQNDIIQTQLINRRAEIFTNLTNSKELSSGYKERVRSIFINRQISYSSLRMDGDKVLMDIFIPIFELKDLKDIKIIAAPNSKNDRENTKQVAGVLAMTLSVKDVFSRLTATQFQALKGQNLYIFQEILGGLQMVRLQTEQEGIFSKDKDIKAKSIYKKAWNIYGLDQGRHDLSKIPKFGAHSKTTPRRDEVLMTKEPVKSIPLTLMIYLDLDETYQGLLLQRQQLHVIGQLISLLIFVLILAFWWKMQNKRHSSLAHQYQEFSRKVNAQRHLLKNINATVDEHITLKYLNGKYVYVNAAFINFLNVKIEEVLDKNDNQLFGAKIAEELKEMDNKLLKTKKITTEEKSFIINDKCYYLAISKTPFLDGHKKFIGIITVVKDLTDIMTAREFREKAMKNSMDSMMHIMQRHDDHLVKHVKYLKRLALDLADKLNLSRDERTTLEVSASLSQLGKIYISKDILNMSDTLNASALEVYRSHIEDTVFILDAVDWGLPVVKTVYAMYEKLDGTGYPNNLHASKISKLSRILCVCNQFCELVSPRRGHKVYTSEAAIKWMVNQKGEYDLSIIQSLAEMISEDDSIVMLG